ncbi:hypothetical protein [Acerihabitans arboris]|uniref:Uncharacterized protein n=1 Tax=Acerihabitans arboris TaxID=2691583 RepID=A0A845SKN0_9GAMM|nr:hypothetical protein [Acerihabitans arboris]NDL63138.1 hypothetical protein [Acerihabitans arboris]
MNLALFFSNLEKNRTLVCRRLENYKNEILVFLVIFILLFMSTTLGNRGTHNSVEQWLNITNQMFYGNQDFLFSYGPLFWLTGGAATQYSDVTYWLSVTFISITNSFFWTLLFIPIHKARNYLFFALIFAIFFRNLSFYAAFFMWPFALVAYLGFSEQKNKIINKYFIIFIGALVALSFFIRFFYGLFGFLTIFSYLFSLFLRDKKLSLLSYFTLSLSITYVLLGLLVFHNHQNIINYIIINMELSFGNSVDMTYDVNNSIRSFVSVLLVLVFLNLFLIAKKRLALFLTINILWLLLFKLGFSRTDHYLGFFVAPATVLSMVMIFDKSLFSRVLFVISMINLYSLAHIPTYPGAVTLTLINKPAGLDESFQERMARIYPDFKLKNEVLDKLANSTVDVYPYNNEYIFSNKLNYLQRPSFQNYMTLTPTLDRMNQDFLNSPMRPKFILWTAGIGCTSSDCNPFDGFDMKYSLNEDPLTSTSILSNYHPVVVSAGKNGIPVMLLEENSHDENFSEALILEKEMRFGQWYSVPKSDDGLLKIKPSFEFTLLGHAKNMLFRGSILKIRYKFSDGEEKLYRVNILNAGSGIVISPLLDKFNTSGFEGREVIAFMFETDTTNYFEDHFTAKLIKINIPNITARKPN